MPRTVQYMLLALALPAVASPPCLADENPMWKSGYDWTCIQGGALTCERGDSCAFGAAREDLIQILFETSEVKIGTESFRIRRHYSQRIDGSPLTDEVKIELTGNSVLWLSPVDAGGTWSKIWTGMIIELKRGAVLSVSRPIYCAPKS